METVSIWTMSPGSSGTKPLRRSFFLFVFAPLTSRLPVLPLRVTLVDLGNLRFALRSDIILPTVDSDTGFIPWLVHALLRTGMMVVLSTHGCAVLYSTIKRSIKGWTILCRLWRGVVSPRASTESLPPAFFSFCFQR